jgi:predicted transcriptional regulator of viral defense system
MPENKRIPKATQIFRQHHGILRTAQAIELGIAPLTLYEMRAAGLVIQEERGLYRLAETPLSAHPDLVQVSLLTPRAVICLISALAFHDLTTQIPHRVYIALPRHIKKPRFQYPALDVVWLPEPAYSAGIEKHLVDGIYIPVYSREKTLADCFRFRKKLGQDVILEALKAYRSQKNVNTAELLHCARINRVEKVMRPYLEALL